MYFAASSGGGQNICREGRGKIPPQTSLKSHVYIKDISMFQSPIFLSFSLTHYYILGVRYYFRWNIRNIANSWYTLKCWIKSLVCYNYCSRTVSYILLKRTFWHNETEAWLPNVVTSWTFSPCYIIVCIW